MKSFHLKILIGLGVLVVLAVAFHLFATKDNSLVDQERFEKIFGETGVDDFISSPTIVEIKPVAHKDENFGYEFTHPSDWQVIDEVSRQGILTIKTISKTTSERPILSQIAFYVREADKEKPNNLYSYIPEGIKTASDLRAHLLSNCEEINQNQSCRYDDIQELKINGRDALLADISYLGALNRFVYILDGDLIYVFVSGRGLEIPPSEFIVEDIAKSLVIN